MIEEYVSRLFPILARRSLTSFVICMLVFCCIPSVTQRAIIPLYDTDTQVVVTMLHRFNRDWKTVRIQGYLKERLSTFTKSFLYKSEAQVVEYALADYMQQKEIEAFGYSVHDLRKHYEDDIETFEKLGIKDFHQYMEYLVAKGEGNMNKVFQDKLEEIKEYMQDCKIELEKRIKRLPEPEKKRY